jgi:phosphoribosylanthranilate isomerase
MTRIKICGITRREDASLAVELGASALGFNFYPSSPRYIAPAAAHAIIAAAVPPPVMAVGIFADETEEVEHVLRVAREAGVGALQLPSSLHLKSPRFAAPGAGNRRYPLILAVTVDDGFKPEQLQNLPASTILLDAPHPTLKGGTGRTIDWAKAREAARRTRVMLAGGLTPENVGEAIRQVRPFAVDVASGVESSPGVKDAAKLRAFFEAVRAADDEMSASNLHSPTVDKIAGPLVS